MGARKDRDGDKCAFLFLRLRFGRLTKCLGRFRGERKRILFCRKFRPAETRRCRLQEEFPECPCRKGGSSLFCFCAPIFLKACIFLKGGLQKVLPDIEVFSVYYRYFA